jgi:large subunit ribosomal protein MRP49
MTVHQTDNQSGPALLTIYFANTAVEHSSTPGQTIDTLAPAPTTSETATTIDVKNKELNQIWTRFKELTGAQELATSDADRQEIEETSRHKEKSGIDRRRVAKIRQAKKDQERLLQAAKADVEKLRAE